MIWRTNDGRTVQEGGRTPPPYPSLFIKPSTSLAAFDAAIPIPKVAQETLDYEAELVCSRRRFSVIRHLANFSRRRLLSDARHSTSAKKRL